MRDFVGVSFTEFCRQMGVKLTEAQTALARIAFNGDGPEFVRHHDPAQDEVRKIFGELPDGPVDEDIRSVFVAVCGRGSGKSYLMALRMLHLALSVDISHLAPGEQASCIIVAPDIRLARQTLRFVRGVVETKLQENLHEENSDQVVLNVRGGRKVAIESLPASAGGRSVRGRSLCGALMDEASFFRDSDSLVNDDEIFKALVPRIVPGGQILVVSTPWAETGLLYSMYEGNWGHPSTALVAWAPTTLMRPDKKTVAMVARERKRDPENARREYDAVFMNTSGSQFFDTRTIDNAFELYNSRIPPSKKYEPLATTVGADLGFTSDHSAFCAVGLENDGIYRSQDYKVLRPEKGKPLKPSEVMSDLVIFAKNNYCETVWGDIHYQELVREHVSNAGLSFAEAPAGAEGKLDQYSKVRALLAEGRVSLKPEDGLREQLLGVTKKPLPGGGMQISQKRSKTGGHSDLASALVLALWAAQVSGTGRIVPDGQLPGWRDNEDDGFADRDFDDSEGLGAKGSAYDL